MRSMRSSNLQCFLDSTTPVVASQFLSKSEIMNLNRLWHPWDREVVEFFTLGDLWSCFDEWSAYGAGVPIKADGETIVQYYVPYLSAIQIFTSNSSLNYLREETDSETRDSSSDTFSEESESEKVSRWDGCSSDDGETPNDHRLGQLYFQYFDKSTPYGRVPLVDKVCALSKKYPGLMSLRSVDLSPASWMAVAWYPIYHIPMGRTIKDLSTCFLTYHTLSSSFQDLDIEDQNGCSNRKRKQGEGIRLPPFGLATYKMQGDIWMSGKDQEKLVSLVSVADSWLRQLGVQHHDFNHFLGNRRS
ncbi:hypothetical protein HanXRQr2_Chr17g0791891 [Helianthus annuus]|uniref:Plant/F9H3-4 protein n=1 Tax=Helianthus annuus TaxID=4232 RepID=A0A251RMU0_HELAN|nr:uncharacterized protein LOC110921583 [Helianthus annuus]KAF5754491.1 hypothetical protein HanXRQr2_Chr17g0791891 [Helianthus annuus]KAJ0428385.1 hypothetical protein HanHA300_Chr17g0645541 [Helianthus annuus]KAJ0432454.1 hypothetical protein HanIR_Chr17g0859421 [Helianthus annuus]KAJ0812240.1 hypothetical protein HanPSC8_Chr17g0759821 [Helianthus annuus]